MDASFSARSLNLRSHFFLRANVRGVAYSSTVIFIGHMKRVCVCPYLDRKRRTHFSRNAR